MPAPRSLRRWAVVEAARLKGGGPWQVAWNAIRRWFAAVVNERWSPPALGLILVAPVLLPICWSPDALEDAQSAEDFLQSLWQVEATVVALSVAVIVFSFEAFGGRAQTAEFSLREFARQARLLHVFWVGMAGLVAIGVVLLGLGKAAPAGWAATWASLLGLITVGAIGWLIARTLKLIDPDGFLDRELARVRAAIEQDTERRVIERVSLARLDQWCSATGVKLDLMFGQSASGSEVEVKATETGSVADLRLRKLQAAIERDGLSSHTPAAKLRVRLGSPVAANGLLLILPKSVGAARLKTYRRCIKINPADA